ncbi:MAG: PAS domain S-box protein [Tepidimonas sp.]|uniref:sensor histidine kinase n=1 Tax=Tepidimonas sp. TaxID=2002775 RepID=UPI00259ECF81|nr:PAS domain S-box protein [Tepidimonas sp.]MDM7457221.1 PAS domain S-box protein [Tepidimonas sp.]
MRAPEPFATSAAKPQPKRPLMRAVWWLPLAASVVFVAAVAALAQYWFNKEAQERRQTLIADALNVSAQLRAQLDMERSRTRTLAEQLRKTPHTEQALSENPEVIAGLRRLWLSVTWLDANHRVIAEAPSPQGRRTESHTGERFPGLSAHLSASYPTAAIAADHLGTVAPPAPEGTVVVRYALPVLLKNAAPWWLTRKYEVQLLDSAEQLIASVDDVAVPVVAGDHETYRLPIDEEIPGALLELSARERAPRLWTPVPLVLMAGFLAFMSMATWLLRRQVQQATRAESAWRNEATWRSAMQDSALVGLRARDAEGTLLYVNRTFCELVGYPPEQLLGRKPPMPYWPPEALEEVMTRSRRNLQGHAPREGFEAVWRRADGQPITVMVYESPLIDASGRQIGWMGSIIDITAKKLLEERERRQLEALARQARLSSFGEIASALAHQLNQPLAAIASYNAGVLQRLRQQGSTDALTLQALERQAEQTREAGRIVQRMREFLTRRQPQRERLDLAAVIGRVHALLRHELLRQHIDVSWRADTPLPPVLADEVLIEQLLINLLRNAADALEGCTMRRIEIRAVCTDYRFAQVHVEDSGPGLQGRSFEELSTPFHTTKPDGLGLGLAICRSVVEAHGGAFDCGVSRWGGARMSFTLPLFTAESGYGRTATTDATAS